MVNFCVVVGCTNKANRSSKDEGIKFFRIPKIIATQGEETRVLSDERRRQWLSAISRADKAVFKEWERICSKHFVNGKRVDLYDKNNIDWIPTLHMGHHKFKPPTPSSEARKHRVKERTARFRAADEIKKKAAELEAKEIAAAETLLDFAGLILPKQPEDGLTCSDLCTPHKSVEQAVQACSSVEHCESQTVPSVSDCQTQSDLTGEFLSKLDTFTINTNAELYRLRNKLNQRHETDPANLEKDNDRVKYYTGLPNFLILTAIFDLICPFLSQTNRSVLSKFQQMMVVLMRLRLNLSEQDLAYRFCVSQSTISRIFRSTLDVMHARLKHLIIWPEREELRQTMPMQFRREFGQRVAVIIDCFEIFTDRPSNLLARAQTWSNYKHHNTLKFLIGITPQGTTSFISKAWGGRTSDKELTERCGFLDKLNPGDIVLADRGFTIEELVAMQGASCHIPAFTRGKKQLSPADVAMTRKIANVRIHVERVIGCTRQKYTILCGPIPLDLLDVDSSGLTVMDKIAQVCCALNNVCPSVVDFE